jgi:hypothetical protein
MDDPDRTPAEPGGPGHEATPEQVDAEFARIVAGFDAVTPGEPTMGEVVPRGPIWPAAGPVLNRPIVLGDPRAVGPDDPSLLDALDTFGTDLPDDTPEEFVPPPPPPLPRIPFAAIVSVLAIVGGFVLFFDTGLLPFAAGVNMLLGLTGVLGGAAALIMRLRPGDDEDELPPDDGAVV